MAENLAAGNFLFASEASAEGCPDKVCDRVADAVLDACVAQDPDARVSCDAVMKTSMVMIIGEVSTKASVNFEQVMREAVKAVGYDSDDKGLDWRTMNAIIAVDEQPPDLAQVVGGSKALDDFGCDQGIVTGYATDETPERMPMSHLLACRLCAQLDKVRKDGTLSWARPGGTAQVIMEYAEKPDGSVVPCRVHSVTLYVPRTQDVKPEQCEKDLVDSVIRPVIPESMTNASTVYRFTDPQQHAQSDVGMSGRRTAADKYGGWGAASDRSMSGRDATRIARSSAYGARWAALSLVAARLCKRASVQLSYEAGSAAPVSVSVNSFGTAAACGKTDEALSAALRRSFDFRPASLMRDFGLKAPQFQKFSAHGHFGRTDIELPWEKPKELK